MGQRCERSAGQLMRIDRLAFFDGYRAAFGRLTQGQVDGLGLLLSSVEDYEDLPDVRWVAYMLATVKHECADTWQPIVERGPKAYFDQYNADTPIGKRLGNTLSGDGFRFRGRGYVQLTGRANYERMDGILGDVGLLLNPDRALIPAIAYQIMVVGMRDGLFTGKKLSDYLNDQVTDYIRARRIINGLDQAERIADYAETLQQIL